MSAEELIPYITPEEYLQFEKTALTKHEYDDGVIVAMAGAKNDHISISGDLTLSVGLQLRGTNCRLRNNDQRVRVEECNRYFYPDLTIVCGKPLYEEREGLEQLTNPSVVFEILSQSTEERDRGIKLHCYLTLPSLLHYVLISSIMPLVTVYSRSAEGKFEVRTVIGLEGTLALGGVGITLSLTEIYEQIEFPEVA